VRVITREEGHFGGLTSGSPGLPGDGLRNRTLGSGRFSTWGAGTSPRWLPWSRFAGEGEGNGSGCDSETSSLVEGSSRSACDSEAGLPAEEEQTLNAKKW